MRHATLGRSHLLAKTPDHGLAKYPSPLQRASHFTFRLTIVVLVSLCIFLLCPGNQAEARESMELVLQDGTVVHGTLDSFVDGIYTINSSTLGTLRIEATKVKSIRSETIPASNPDAQQALQNKILGDAAVMDLVKSLQQDPDFQAILSDKETLRAINAGDLSSLEHNQKIKALINNSTVKEIGQRLSK